MYWIALKPSQDEERTAWAWRALQFTPRVAQVDEAVLLEASASEQLFGGRKRLLRRLLDAPPLPPVPWASGSSSLVALALLRLKLRGEARPADVDSLPVDTLSAAAAHVALLERTGCRTWGDLRALPRAGLARRFGAALVDALDAAYGQRPERYEWITLPERFDINLELPALATGAPELMWTGQRLLSLLQQWLAARNLGLLALELEWTLDLRRLDGKPLPPTQSLQVRTAQPTQEMAHLRRLVHEQLARATLLAPANHLRLRSVETVPWGGRTASLLPEDHRKGEALHQCIERLSARLGEHNVQVARACEDHRPERVQQWVPARGSERAVMPGLTRHPVQRSSSDPGLRVKPAMTSLSDALYPPWLLREPQPLEVRNHQVLYGGPLRHLSRLYRVETAWWEEGGPAVRDYFIARSEQAGLVWVFRERAGGSRQTRWFLQGLYA